MSSGFRKTNLVSMSKATTENDKNVSTKIVAATFENNLVPEEVSGERVWRRGECSNIYFFLLSITERFEDINKYLNNVSIFPVDITQSQLNAWTGTNLDPSKFDSLALRKVQWQTRLLNV